ncbi:MAG: hypothetical protein H0W25_06190 [Acidimicrobiia bacterium]|nr:hypothetical protein [Acidimicrobiia bacterium]
MAGETKGSTRALKPGERVDVRNRFDGRWSPGFEVEEEAGEGGYRVRRTSDGSVLPVVLDRDDIRRERKRETWWL